ncbi:MAG: FecR domain-containing protein, partial [Burkholderiales bacterium]|nr:FecR domain-containing protein [Burkholderiales bacterium]
MLRSMLAGVGLCVALSGCDRARDPDAGAALPPVAGTVELVEGEVRFLDRGRRARHPSPGDPLHEGESIETGPSGEVHLRMDDGGYMAVRSSTRLRIVNFRAEGNDGDRSLVNLLEGSFRSVTGWIAKTGAQRVTVQTPTATIGIRGTDHEPLVIPAGSSRGEAGTYDRVYAGETEIRTQQGTVRVRPNQAGFAPREGASLPRVLARIPGAFRPARDDARFAGLHARVQRELDQRRDDRRRDVEERRRLRDERKRTSEKAREDRRKTDDRQREKEDKRKAEERRRELEDKRKAEERRREQEDRR